MDEDAAMDMSPYSTEMDIDDKPINTVAFDFGQSKPEWETVNFHQLLHVFLILHVTAVPSEKQ